MRNLVKKLYTYQHTENYYFQRDITEKVIEFEKAFEMFSKHGDSENVSKEIFEDMIVLTHMDKEGISYIGVSTLESSDALIKIDDTIEDLRFTKRGIDVILSRYELKHNTGGNKEYQGTGYLGYKVYIIDINATIRNTRILDLHPFIEKYNSLPISAEVNKDYILVVDDKNRVLKLDHKFNLLEDYSNLYRDEVDSKYRITYDIFSDDLIVCKVIDESLMDDFFTFNYIKNTYLHSVEKGLLQRVPESTLVNGILGIDEKDYVNKGYLWVAGTNDEFTEDEKKKLVDNMDGSGITYLYNKVNNSILSGLVPIYNITGSESFFMDKLVVIAPSMNVEGGIVKGIDVMYTIDSSNQKDIIYKFYECDKNEIIADEVHTTVKPQKIYYNKYSSGITFSTKGNGISHIVSYLKDYGDIIKLSKLHIKADDNNELLSKAKTLKEYIYAINDDDDLGASEFNSLVNAINNKSYFEEIDDNEVLVTHYANLTTGAVNSDIINISYDRTCRLMMEKTRDNVVRYIKTYIADETYHDLIEREKDKEKSTQKYAKEKLDNI